MRAVVPALVALLLLPTGCTGEITPQRRDTGGTVLTAGTALRFCVDLDRPGCDAGSARIPAGDAVTPRCWAPVTGRPHDRGWLWVSASNGTVGYVEAQHLSGPAEVPACRDDVQVVAVEEAALRVAQVTADPPDRALFPATHWEPGPAGEWSGDCIKLPFVAWHRAGVALRQDDALVNYRYYRDRGAVRTTYDPPLGAVVWYDVGTPIGHEAIYLGDGMLASTLGNDGDGLPIQIVPIREFHDYLGWYDPSRQVSNVAGTSQAPLP